MNGAFGAIMLVLFLLYVVAMYGDFWFDRQYKLSVRYSYERYVAKSLRLLCAIVKVVTLVAGGTIMYITGDIVLSITANVCAVTHLVVIVAMLKSDDDWLSHQLRALNKRAKQLRSRLGNSRRVATAPSPA
jgi:hypothetical protein